MFLKFLRQVRVKKITAALTAASFMLSIFASGGWAVPAQSVSVPAAANVNTAKSLSPSNFVVPFNIGRVTDSVNFKSDKVIIQIQDLHAHEETQRNISSILSLLDSKYKINKVYVEGAVGDVDTSWLANISDENLRTSILNSLLSQGILTGSELFSVNSGKTNILKGIEDREAYLDNFQRLVTIDSRRDQIKQIFPEIRMVLSYLADRNYGKENKKIESVVNKYKNGKISFEKYFTYIIKKAKKQDVYFGFYPSLTLLSSIINVQNKLNKDKINSQISSFLEDLKSEISYGEYKELMDYSSKPETEGVFYFKLAETYNKGNYGGKYPELVKFLQFISLNQAINPIDLVNEERALLWEVRSNAAKNNKEKELLYLSHFVDLMEGFLENKITAPEYKYFERELPKFKTLWTKYTRMSEFPGLEQYYSLFENFYKVNVERNNIFVKEINGKLPKTREANMAFSTDMIMTEVSGLLSNAKEIEVVVTGGFHTQDVSRILQNAHQSYVVITPNVTQDAAFADKLFAEDVIRISKYIPANTYQKALVSNSVTLAGNTDVKTLAGSYFQKAVLDAFKSNAAQDGIDVTQQEPEVVAAAVNNAIAAYNPALKDFELIKLAFDGDDYIVTAKADGKSEETFKITNEGVLGSEAQEYNVREARAYGISGIVAGAVIVAASVLGIFFAPIIVPATVILGLAAAAGLGISGVSAISVSNANQVRKALEAAKGIPETEAQKNAETKFIEHLKEVYSDELGEDVDIIPNSNMDVIARFVDGKIQVNALALMILAESHPNLIENILIKHELAHVKTKSELIAHSKDIFSRSSIASISERLTGEYRKGLYVESLLNFMRALDDYNHIKKFNGATTRERAARIRLIRAIDEYVKSNAAYDDQFLRDVLSELEEENVTDILSSRGRFVNMRIREADGTVRPQYIQDGISRTEVRDALNIYGNLIRSFNITAAGPVAVEEARETSDFERDFAELRRKVEVYKANMTKENFEEAEKALEALGFDIRNESMERLKEQVVRVGSMVQQLYNVSQEEQDQQDMMTQEYIRGIKEGHKVDVEGFLADENLDSETVMMNYPGLVTRLSDIDDKYGLPEYLKNVAVAFNLGLAGIGESLKRTEFLKAWYVLKVRQGEAKTEAEREAISRAVETGEFLKAEWYEGYYARLINDIEMQEKYGLDITTGDNPRFNTKAGDPQLKTKALDIGLRVKGIDGYWTIKSVAEIILDDFIAKKNAGFAGLTLNLLTNDESIEDVKALLARTSYTGRTYGEELVNLGVLKSVYGEGYEGYDNTAGLYLQRTHPTIQYNEATGKVNYFGFQQLINHGSFFAKLFRQMSESRDDQDGYWFFGNTDNYEAGQVPAKLFGWMADTKTAATVIVTEKGTSEGNKKGGIPMIVGTAMSALGTAVPIYKIVEIAQVKGKTDLEEKFQEAEHAFFNTNMLVANKAEIKASLAELEEALNNEDVVRAISQAYPMKGLNSKEEIMKYLHVLGDLIINDKGNYIKLEIAIASSMMEFNNLVALATGKTLLKFVLLSDEEAKAMFGPIKNQANFEETFEKTKVITNADGTQEFIFED
ncbi:MAG: hypothetical protein FWH43_07590, partial [Endomicrobia bacterium]|nr:hypothetical protein [Endomicrobiia bacterium]